MVVLLVLCCFLFLCFDGRFEFEVEKERKKELIGGRECGWERLIIFVVVVYYCIWFVGFLFVCFVVGECVFVSWVVCWIEGDFWGERVGVVGGGGVFVELGVVCGGGGGVFLGVLWFGMGMLLKRVVGGVDVGVLFGEMYLRNVVVLGVSVEFIVVGGEEEVMGEVDRDVGGDWSCRYVGCISCILFFISMKY